MTFTRHAFISYAHLDNEPLLDDAKGWVTKFHETLRQLLTRNLGCKVDIWRDQEKLDGSQIFNKEILDQFPETAVLISVLTPRYVQSKPCREELDAFYEAAERNGGVVVGNRSRIFKVMKTPIDDEEGLRPIFREILGYPFFEIGADDMPREVDPAFGKAARDQFLDKVTKVAWDMKTLLVELMRDPAEAGQEDEAPAKPSVYLAECARDRREHREMIGRELQRLGYPVLPDRPLPTDEAELVAEVERLLARCSVSVHLVGSGYGVVPDGAGEKSVVVLQNELAVRASRKGPLKRVISLPAGTESTHADQQAFIEALHTDPDAQFGADLLTGSVEDVKAAVLSTLKNIEKAAEPAADPSTRKRVYVICEAEDRKLAVPLLRALKARGIDAPVPVFSGDPAQVREANHHLLSSSDAAIVFYASGSEAWMSQQRDAIRGEHLKRANRRPFHDQVYLAGSMTDDKDLLLNTGEPGVIDGIAGFNEDSLKPLFDALGLK